MPKTTSEEARCRACGRLRPASAIERALGFQPAVPADAPNAEPDLYSVDPFEERAIRAAALPAWKGKARDARMLREALATSISMTGDEKLAVLEALSKLSQEQVENVTRILREEREKFATLNRQHREKVARVEDEYARASEALPLEAFIPEGVTADAALSPTDYAGLIRDAIEPLLRCLGPGDASRVFRVVFERLAAQVEAGGATILQGFLPDLLAPVLRDPLLNPHAGTPAQDTVFLDSLVRPSLSRLRAASPSTLVRLRGMAYRACLLLSGPERPRGPVRQTYRIGVQLILHTTHALDTWRYRTRLMSLFLKLVGNAPYEDVLPLAAFGPLGAHVARAVEIRGYRSPGARRLHRLQGALTLLDRVLPLLHFEEKATFVAELLAADLAPRASAPRFDDWFFGAVAFPTLPEDDFLEACLALLPMLEELSFTERVAVLGHLRQLPSGHRDVNTLFVAFRAALTAPARTTDAQFTKPAIDLDQVIAERVLHPDAFVALIDRDLAAVLLKP